MSAGPESEVHVVDVEVDEGMGTDAALLSTLDDDELRRASRFHFDLDRAAFVACRATVRSWLGAYLGCSASAVRLSSGPRGKPCLAAEFSGSSLQFNVSHSGRRGLVAFARGRAVGVDIERIRVEVSLDEIYRQFFAEAEVRAAQAFPEPERLKALFHGWARKEAFVKATGQGLWMPMDGFCVDLTPSTVDVALTTFADRAEASKWRLIRIDAPSGYVAALAVRGHGWSVRRSSFFAQKGARSVPSELGRIASHAKLPLRHLREGGEAVERIQGGRS